MKPYFNKTIAFNRIGITRYQNGMMLYDACENTDQHSLLLSFGDLFALPYSVYLLDKHGTTVNINEIGAKICGFQTPELAIGKTIFDVSAGASAKDLLNNCESVLQQESVKLFDEFNTRFDGRLLHFLSVKYPCYDTSHQLQGTLGVSIVIGEHPLAEAITHLTHLGLLPKNTPPKLAISLKLGNVSLTPREQECLEHTVKGYTAKQIAKKLSISPRTVEEYINQIKLKFDVGSKQELIQKVLG
ncbi:MAG: LuxR C-terminal-related transcriptional regulator [Gammaproteobacteria bacterium]|nr:LuxR C-terminal-related transcriptional regulator [Gammaproteobacteria bacterium]